LLRKHKNSMQHLTDPGRGNTGSLWPTQTIRKLYKAYTATLLLNSLTISSPSDFLRWNLPNANIPNPSFNVWLPTPTIGRISRFFGFNESRRYLLLRLFDLAYSFRIRLPLLVSAGFALFHYFSNYNLELELEIDSDEEDDEEVEIEIEIDIEDSDED